jgi:hypothetical protein
MAEAFVDLDGLNISPRLCFGESARAPIVPLATRA